MQSCAVRIGLVALVVALIAGCGGGGNTNVITPAKNTNGVVGQVTLAPVSLSIVAGQVSTITASAVNPTGGAVSPLPTFTFTSSNTAVASISPAGDVCAGVWDALFIVCNGKNASGNPISGSAQITASAEGVTSAPIVVSVHAPVTSIAVVGPASGACFSVKQTFQFSAKACSTAVTPHDTTGPCAPNATDITSQIGTFSWTETVPAVATVDANGVATANAPGVTGVIASVGSVASPFTNFRSCMPVQIRLHLNGDPAGQPTESSSIAVAATLTMQADMVDENNVTTNSAPVTILSNNTELAQLSGTILTGESPGGAGILAACIPPTCGAGLHMPVYSNLFSLTVTGTSPVTTIYATSSFSPPAGTIPTMIPIDTSKSPIVAGTAINLPGAVNSLVFNALGTTGYMGTTAGFAALDTTTNAVSLLDPFVGAVLAVSPDGSTVILSNAVQAPDPVSGVVQPIQSVGPSQRLVIFSTASNTITSLVLPGAVAAAFTSDSSTAYVAVDCTHNTGPAPVTPCPSAYVFSTTATLQSLTLSGTVTTTGAATIASGPFAFLINGSPAGLQAVGTCNNLQQPSAPAVTSAVQLVGSTQNADMIVAVNQTGVDIETATITQLTPPLVLTPANCAPGVTYSDQFVDFGIGAFTARQLMVPTNGTGGTNGSHILVLPEGKSEVFVAVPGSAGAAINLPSGATEALSGGLTPDGNTAWVGVGGTNTVDQLSLTSTSDVLQIKMSFTKSDGTAAPPNIVGVKPH